MGCVSASFSLPDTNSAGRARHGGNLPEDVVKPLHVSHRKRLSTSSIQAMKMTVIES
jgi:hypothetical protein